MSSLYILGGDSSEENVKAKYYYIIGSGSILNPGEVVNDALELNSIAKNYAQEFSDYIFSLNKILFENQTFLKKISLYHLSDLSCKRTELFDTYSTFCNVFFLKKFITDNNIDIVYFDCCNYSLQKSLTNFFPSIDFKVISEKKTIKKFKSPLVKNIIFFSKVLISRVIEDFIFLNNKNNKNNKNFFLTRFPSHLSKNYKEDKFSNLLNSSDRYLINLHTDGFHQSISVYNYIKFQYSIKRLGNGVILDNFIGYRDIFKCLFYSYKICQSFRPLYDKDFIFKGVNLTKLIHDELSLSKIRIPRLLLIGGAFRSFCKQFRPVKFYYYLHEYSYGKVFTYVGNVFFPKMKLYAFQHGPSSSRKLVYFSGKGELNKRANGISSFYLPDKLFSEDTFSLGLYNNAGYVNVTLMNKIYRLSYLGNISINQKKDFFLIVPGLNDGKILIKSLINVINTNSTKKYIIKPHPRAEDNYLERYKDIINLYISYASIESLLPASKKIYTSYSSVGIEAKILGIDVELVEIPGKVNESPLIVGDFLSCIQNIKY